MNLTWNEDGESRWSTPSEASLFYRIFYSKLTKKFTPVSYENHGSHTVNLALDESDTLDGAKAICQNAYDASPYKDL